MKNDADYEIISYIDTFLTVRGLSENTKKSYKEDLFLLKTFISSLNIDIYSLDKYHAELFIKHLMDEGLSKRSINRVLSSCRGFYKNAYRLKKIPVNPFSGIKNSNENYKLPVFLTKPEVDSFISKNNKSDSFTDIRNLSILTLLYSTGGRREEIQSIDVKDIDFLNSEILVKGKGNKERLLFITHDAETYLKKYINERNKIVVHSDALFINKRGYRLSLSSFNNIFNSFEKVSGIQKHVTPHTIRHSFATQLMDNGMDIRSLQELLGHSSISTTGIYTHLSLQNLKNIYSKSHPHA